MWKSLVLLLLFWMPLNSFAEKIVDNDDIETDEEITAEDHETEPMTEALEETPSEWLEDVVDVAGVEEDTLESIEEVDAQDTEAETL